MTLQWKLIARDGFTLIELLVVIAIVAILISLSSVALLKPSTRQKAFNAPRTFARSPRP